jgi:hypothetical protein
MILNIFYRIAGLIIRLGIGTSPRPKKTGKKILNCTFILPRLSIKYCAYQ